MQVTMDPTTEINYALGITRICMQALGLWPRTSNKLRLTIIAIYLLALTEWFAGQYAYYITKKLDWMPFIVKIKHTVVAHMFIGKYLLAIIAGSQFGECLSALERDWHNVKLTYEIEIMRIYATKGRYYALICFILSFTTVTLQLIVPLTPLSESRAFPYPSHYWFDYQSSPYYEIVYTLKIFSSTILAACNVTVDGFIIILIMHVIGQLELVSEHIRNMEVMKSTIETCVQRHRVVIWMAETLENSFNLVFLCHFMVSAIVMCLAGYSLMKSVERNESLESVISMFFIGSIAFHLFLYCYVSDKLTEKSLQVGYSAYCCNWYQHECKQSKPLLILMIRSSRSLKLSAGKFIVLSLENFTDVLKTTGAYLSVLRKF
ncbi:Odorant receptor 55 [Cephus cinctus]|uniref:Odorant receptor n=2 Tax=Cephus cinctus TaxID=211228 RepID=A0A3L9LU14_CEPCN|nr:odorant receptor 4 isoform X2 [Cephus cinctus]RLZ02265.1 Odorant receptor 55 [Cephus cinctus]